MALWPDNRLLDLLQIEHAIIQAPMAGSTTPALASAVSNAGALGSLGCAMMDTGAASAAITALRGQTNRAFNINFFCHQPPGDDAAKNARATERLRPFFEEYGLGPVPAVEASNFPFDEAMLSWPPGPRPTDGPWSVYWYGSVVKSTSFMRYQPKNDPVPARYAVMLEECNQLYAEMSAHRLV